MDSLSRPSQACAEEALENEKDGLSSSQFKGDENHAEAVAIPPAPLYEDDGKAIDIHIDENRNPFHGSSSQMASSDNAEAHDALNLDRKQPHQPGDDGVASSAPSTSRWFTPARAAQEATLLPDPGSMAVCGVTFIHQEASQAVKSSAGTEANGPDIPERASSQNDASPSHQPATEQDFLSSLPHPQAIFRADELEWQVLFCPSNVEPMSQQGFPATCEEYSDIHLWQCQGVVSDYTASQARNDSFSEIVTSRDSACSSGDMPMEKWQSSQGSLVYSTQRGAFTSIIPKSLLMKLRDDRMQNPRINVDGHTQFQDSILTLIRIIGNASNGESRGFSCSSKLVSNKLGLDAITHEIFGGLGFRKGLAEGDRAESWYPPSLSGKDARARLLRACVELVLWYEYQCQCHWILKPQQVASHLSLLKVYPQGVPCRNSINQVFHSNPEDRDASLDDGVSSGCKSALERIGARGGDKDRLIDACYLANTALGSPFERLTLYHAMSQIGNEFRYRDSEVIQTRLAIEKSHGLPSYDEIKQAYRMLDIEIESLEHALSISDEVIVDLFSSSGNSSAANIEKVSKLKGALSVISQSRGKPGMLEAALSLQFELSLEKAYEMLEVNKDLDDDFIISIFSVGLSESHHSAAECTEALRVIAEHRNSAELRKAYRSATGQEDAWEAPAADMPAGLNNIGNTCYLNSVLQYFFAIKPLRERVLQAGQMQRSSLGNLQNLRIAGRNVTQKEFERSTRFVVQLAQLFSAMISMPVTALTPERDLAYLALVSPRWDSDEPAPQQPLTEQASKEAGASWVPGTEGSHANSVSVEQPMTASPTEVRDMTFKDSRSSSRAASRGSLPPSSPPPLPLRPSHESIAPSADLGQRRNSLMQLGAQQDVSECLDNVMSQVETALTAQPLIEAAAVDVTDTQTMQENEEWVAEGDLLRRLFLGRTCQRVEMEDQRDNRGSSVHIKREVFKTLPVDVLEEGRDIYDGLDGFFDEETLEGPNGKPMQRTVTLTDAPAVLQIQLQRVQYDRVRGIFKSQATLEMGESLFMDRYLDFDQSTADDTGRLAKRKRSREVRREVAALRARIKLLRPTKDSLVSRHLSKTSDLFFSLKTAKRPQHEADESARSDSGDAALNESKLTNIDDAFGQFLTKEAQLVEAEIEAAEKRLVDLKAEVEELWSTEKRVEYILASVFMHRGEASHGHYFLNQRKLLSPRGDADKLTQENAQPSTWFKYNDNVVQQTSLSQVLRDTTGATPYLVSYVRKDMQADIGIFDTVCRMIETGSAPEAATQIISSDATKSSAAIGEGSMEEKPLLPKEVSSIEEETQDTPMELAST